MASNGAALKTLFPIREDRPKARVRLVCFPYAGGTAAIFAKWAASLPDVDVCAAELPGRGRRFGEPPVAMMDALADGMASALAPLFDRPVVLFGHSLGARLAFQLALREPRVRALVASASEAPSRGLSAVRSTLPRDALVAELRRLGGTHPDVLADEEVMDLLLPMVRADFALAEFRARPDARVGCPIHLLVARDDHEVPEDPGAWQRCTTGSFRRTELPDGGHFFVTTRADVVLREVRAVLDAIG